MTEIGFFRNNKKKTNKISQISYFFPTLFLVHRKVRCPPKVLPNPTSIHIYICVCVCVCVFNVVRMIDASILSCDILRKNGEC